MEHDLPINGNVGRQLNEMALTSGRKRQSKQTGFVHLFYHETEEEIHQTIPLAENVYFILALLRTKISENIAEGKELLDRLLYFQNAEGNFPVYVHEFPKCNDRFQGRHLLPALYYIMEEFKTVLGADLKLRLQSSVGKLLKFILQTFEEKPSSYMIGVKIAALTKVWGQYFNDIHLEEKGEALLKHYREEGMQLAWFIPTALADLCSSLQLVYLHIQTSPWKDFWQHLKQTWHQPTASYIGPALRQYQQDDQPQPTFYDLYLGYFTRTFSERVLDEASYHLQAVLIRPTEELMLPLELPFKIEGVIHGSSWCIHQQTHYAFSLMDKKALQNPAHENAFHPLYLIWGRQEKVHSFVCQGGNFTDFSFHVLDNHIELEVLLSPDFEVQDREKSRELSFFFNAEPDLQMTIHEQKASTFDLKEEFKLVTQDVHLFLTVMHSEGEGQFLGHLVRGNRPSQIHAKGIHRFKSFDWHVFFRTLRRSSTCKLRAVLGIHPCGK